MDAGFALLFRGIPPFVVGALAFHLRLPAGVGVWIAFAVCLALAEGIGFAWRFLVALWKWLFFTPGPLQPDPGKSALVNRGAYLAQALGHCGECHTPRNWLGAPKKHRYLAGAKLDEGTAAPNLTPTRLKRYGDGELKDILTSGLFPDGDVLGDTMSEVVRNTTSKLTPPDLDALIAYLRNLPPLPGEPK